MIDSRITLIESAGSWPTTVVEDIINARNELAELGHGVLVATQFLGYYTPVDVRVSPRLHEALNRNIPVTTVSYRRFLEGNNVATFIEDDGIEDDVALVSFENDTIQINGLEIHSSNQTASKEEEA
ncbi:unnamed protein product [marine sediment metagenome]|uniref:Uncharacterized protein n=1 Tax=marine sediment metagenome TaxID=412755 RepID=X0TUX7_9ZZZZ